MCMKLRKVLVISKPYKSFFSINVADICLLQVSKHFDHIIFLDRTMHISAQMPISESLDLNLMKCISYTYSGWKTPRV